MNKAPSIFGKNSKEQLEKLYNNGMLVVHSEYPYREYLVFDNLEHFHHYSGKKPQEQRCYHEVIIGNAPRNLYVDIDSYDVPADEYRTFCCELIRVFWTYAEIYFMTPVDIDKNVVVISACGYSELKMREKFSLHIRINNIATTPREMEAFAKLFAQRISRPEAVDMGVYKPFQCIRTMGSTKRGDNRPSRIVTRQSAIKEDAFTELQRSMIGYKPCIGPTAREWLQAPVDARLEYVETNDETVNYVIAHTEEHQCGYTFRNFRGNCIYFKRTEASYCDICERVHDSDNALRMTVEGDHVTKSCFRDEDKHRVRILELPDNLKTQQLEQPEIPKLTPKQRLEKLIAADITLAKHNFVGKRDVYSEPAMRSYVKHADANAIIIQAQKGVGKTENLVKMIDEKYRGATIIALSHRETFSAELCRQFAGFTNYKDIKGPINPLVHPRIVVQIESLSRLTFDELRHHNLSVDLLIMDESESIIEQLSSGLDKKFAKSWDNFNWLTQYSEHVIAMDANVTNRTFSLLQDRPANKCGVVEQVFVQNNFKKAADTEYKITTDDKEWRASLFEDLAAGLNLFIPCNSATEAEALHKDITKLYPLKDVKCYTGATDQQVKRNDIENINSAWNCEVLIFTPTITSGVSYKMENFDKTYAWFKHNSCTVLACDQMLGRVRDISTRTVVVYVDSQRSESWTTYSKLKASILQSRSNLFARFAPSWLSYETTPTGIKIHNERFFNVLVSNELARNHSRSDFMGEFVRLIKRSGARVTMLEPIKTTPDIEEVHQGALVEVKKVRIDRIVEAEDITDEKYVELCAKPENTPAENIVKHKKYLRNVYSHEGEIDSFFVENYDTPQAINWFRNLHTYRAKTLDDIQVEERERFIAKQDKVTNWTKKYQFEHHRIAQSVLGILGYAGIDDTITFSGREIYDAIQVHKATLIAQYDHTLNTLKIRSKRPTFDKLKQSLEYLNTILYAVYGIKVAGRHTKKGTIDYKINHKHSFDTVTFRPKTIAMYMNCAEKNELTCADVDGIYEFLNSL